MSSRVATMSTVCLLPLWALPGSKRAHAALTSNKRLALANKESLVVGGDLLMPLAQPGQLIPVDSEHSAIYQCYLGENRARPTAFGSPARAVRSLAVRCDELDRVTRARCAGTSHVVHGR